MKMGFIIKGLDSDDSVKLDVKIQTAQHHLTRAEGKRFKESVRNRCHQMLRDIGYDAAEIKITK